MEPVKKILNHFPAKLPSMNYFQNVSQSGEFHLLTIRESINFSLSEIKGSELGS